MTTPKIDIKDIDLRVILTDAITDDDLDGVHRLFEDSYNEASYSYLEKSFTKLRYISLAVFKDDIVGFGVADAVEAKLPRLSEPQIVILGGISCVAADYRRLGLFGRLETMAYGASEVMRPAERYLLCGRMAHPVSFRSFRRFEATIPKNGVRLSDWHKEIGLKVAEIYGVNIDPETLVVIGDGSPCGYPKVKSEVSEEEWLPFKTVNRERGDSLLGISWAPNAPADW